MIKCRFEQVVYRKPNNYRTEKRITSVIGLDTETYTDGTPYMFALSDKSLYTPADIPAALFTRKYRNKNFGVWNLKFDAGSLLHDLSPTARTELRENTTVKYNGYRYRYIPHKMLRISKGKNGVTFWDINTFFHMPLDAAAKKYLKDKKRDIETKKFTRRYVKKNWDTIRKYCIHDAVLVKRLYDYFYKGLAKLDIHPKNLYSPAAISQHYFSLHTDIDTVWRYWQYYRELLEYACRAYNGGMFEIYTRGRFDGISYDINSAYPYEIKNLVSLAGATVYKARGYEPDAMYGFLHVHIDNKHGVHIPSACKWGPVNIYPAGSFNTYITLQEYKYLKSIGVRVRIYDGWYIIPVTDHKPYRDVINDLYRKKQSFKNRDPRMYMIVKLMLNGYYGKMIQLVEHPDGKYYAGGAFNPVHAAVITANTRIKLCKICNDNIGHVLAVHTDSVIMDRPLNLKNQGKRLGDWAQETDGDGVMIACGIYQLGDKTKFRGMDVKHDFTWLELLKRSRNRAVISMPHTTAVSWVHANFRHNDALTNRFIRETKQINLNADSKRAWPGTITARDLLRTQQSSFPHILTDPALSPV